MTLDHVDQVEAGMQDRDQLVLEIALARLGAYSLQALPALLLSQERGLLVASEVWSEQKLLRK